MASVAPASVGHGRCRTSARAAASLLRQGHALGPTQRVLRPLAARGCAVALHEAGVLLTLALVSPGAAVGALIGLPSWPQQLPAWHRCRRGRRARRRLARHGLGPIVALHRPVHWGRDSLRCPVLAVRRLANTAQGTQSHSAYEEEGEQRRPGRDDTGLPARPRRRGAAVLCRAHLGFDVLQARRRRLASSWRCVSATVTTVTFGAEVHAAEVQQAQPCPAPYKPPKTASRAYACGSNFLRCSPAPGARVPVGAGLKLQQ